MGILNSINSILLKHLYFSGLVWWIVALQAMAQADSVMNVKPPVAMYLKQSAVPVVLIGAGFYMKLNHTSFNDHSVQHNVYQQYPDFHTHAEDYLRFAFIPVVYGFDWAGVKAKTDLVNRTVILLKGELIMGLTSYTLKHTTHVIRPNGEDDYSFPSGHTAEAFLGAVFIHRELGHKSILFPIAGYTIAASVGALRILNNEHWTSDVFVGAALGYLCGKQVVNNYHRYNKIQKDKLGKAVNSVTFNMQYLNGKLLLGLVYRF